MQLRECILWILSRFFSNDVSVSSVITVGTYFVEELFLNGIISLLAHCHFWLKGSTSYSKFKDLDSSHHNPVCRAQTAMVARLLTLGTMVCFHFSSA